MQTNQKLKYYFIKLYPVAVIIVLFVASFQISNALSFGRTGIMPAIWLDSLIPYWAPSVYVYILAFVQWVAVPVALSLIMTGEGRRRMLITLALSIVVSTVILIVMPTYTVRPVITGTTFADKLMAFIYSVDLPRNELPSLHVLASWALARLLYSCKSVPLWIRISNYVFSILVIASVLLTKQHLILDIPTAIVLYELCFLVSKKLADMPLFKKIIIDI